MRARIVYHDGTVEKTADVAQVYETDDALQFVATGHTQPLHYPKDGGGVKYVQLVWHDEY